MRFLWTLIFSIYFPIVYAASVNQNWSIQSPPKSNDARDNYNYNNILFNHFNTLQVTTTNPNGNRQGNIGDMVIYQATGNVYKFEVQVVSPIGKSWQGVNLGVI